VRDARKPTGYRTARPKSGAPIADQLLTSVRQCGPAAFEGGKPVHHSQYGRSDFDM